MTSVPTLHFMCGKAGSGKSTLADRLAAEHGAILLCEDVWLTRLFGAEMRSFDDYRVYSQRLRTVVASLVRDLLAAGQSVVLDFPANTPAARDWFRSIFEGAGAAHVLHFVDTPEARCLQRIAMRNDQRPEGSHQLTEADFEHITSFFRAPEPAEGFHVVTHR